MAPRIETRMLMSALPTLAELENAGAFRSRHIGPDEAEQAHMLSVVGAERILYGSDAPIRDYASQLAKVTGARISDRERQRILGENAARLLNL